MMADEGPEQVIAGQTTGSQTTRPRWQEHIMQRSCSAVQAFPSS
jgi:hypothetical protein